MTLAATLLGLALVLPVASLPVGEAHVTAALQCDAGFCDHGLGVSIQIGGENGLPSGDCPDTFVFGEECDLGSTHAQSHRVDCLLQGLLAPCPSGLELCQGAAQGCWIGQLVPGDDGTDVFQERLPIGIPHLFKLYQPPFDPAKALTGARADWDAGVGVNPNMDATLCVFNPDRTQVFRDNGNGEVIVFPDTDDQSGPWWIVVTLGDCPPPAPFTPGLGIPGGSSDVTIGLPSLGFFRTAQAAPTTPGLPPLQGPPTTQSTHGPCYPACIALLVGAFGLDSTQI
jgi:hypothetical protein